MKAQDVQLLPESERIHFCKCATCPDYFDMRDLDDVFFHEDHKPHPDAQYSGSKRVEIESTEEK